jgi:hypothetical protein
MVRRCLDIPLTRGQNFQVEAALIPEHDDGILIPVAPSQDICLKGVRPSEATERFLQR